jgi:cell division protein YceG involved in septum cleavage
LKPTEAPAPTEAPEPTKEPESSPKNRGSGETVRFTVNRGEDSYTVAKRLEAAGFVDSASAFDSYLCKNNLDRRIYAGDYDLPDTGSYEEIGRILSGR